MKLFAFCIISISNANQTTYFLIYINDLMEFHSEWLLDDPIEVLIEINKEVYSQDEIEKLSTKENLSEIDKAYKLLESGQICQKLWVVRNLHNLMQEPKFHEIIAELIVIST